MQEDGYGYGKNSKKFQKFQKIPKNSKKFQKIPKNSEILAIYENHPSKSKELPSRLS